MPEDVTSRRLSAVDQRLFYSKFARRDLENFCNLFVRYLFRKTKNPTVTVTRFSNEARPWEETFDLPYEDVNDPKVRRLRPGSHRIDCFYFDAVVDPRIKCRLDRFYGLSIVEQMLDALEERPLSIYEMFAEEDRILALRLMAAGDAAEIWHMVLPHVGGVEGGLFDNYAREYALRGGIFLTDFHNPINNLEDYDRMVVATGVPLVSHRIAA